jgi:DNA-binding transcriptional regulator YhcF (GntR family)
MPIYMEIMNDLLKDIKSGKYLSGKALPTEKELKKAYNTSRTSIRSSLRELQNRGFIDKKRGSGNYVRKKYPPQERKSAINIGLITDLHDGKEESGIFASTLSRKIVLGTQKVLDKENANLTVAMYNRSSKSPGKEINSGYPIDGFLDIGGTISEALSKYFETSSGKVVSIRPSHSLYKFQYSNPLVILDECEGIKKALNFYKKKGFSKFGYLGVAENGLRSYRMFQAAFKEENAVFDSSCVMIHPEGADSVLSLWERVQQIAAHIINNKMEPEVFFFDGLTVADYLIKFFIEKNTGLEKNVKFCALGFKDDSMNPLLLDLIEPQYQTAGEKAVELLIEYINNGKIEQDRILVPSIFVSN